MRRIGFALGTIGGLALTLTAAVSCEEDSAGPSAEDAPQVVAGTVCRWHFECGCDEDMNSRFTSRENCELTIAADVQADIDRGQEADLIYAENCVGSYLDGLNALQCATSIDVLGDVELQRAFREIADCKLFYGMREAGQSCVEEEDDLGDTCRPELRCENNVCVVPAPVLSEGEDCDPQNSGCEPGLLCLDIDNDDTSSCESLPTGGETCKGMADLCAAEFFCEQESKTCVALPGPGEECSAFMSITLNRCNAEGICNAQNEMCDPVPQAGEACTVKCAQGLLCQQQVCVVVDPIACLYDG